MLNIVWLHKWISSSFEEKKNVLISTDDIDEKDAIFMIKTLPEYNDCSTILKDIEQGINNIYLLKLIDIAIASSSLWTHTSNKHSIYNIIVKSLQLEKQLTNSNKTILYHAQNLTFDILDLAMKYASRRYLIQSDIHISDENIIKASHISRYGIFSRKYITNSKNYLNLFDKLQDMRLLSNDISDDDESIRSRLISVNYSIFGNYGPNGIGESTLNYLIHNYNQSFAEEYIGDIPFVTTEECEKIKDIMELYNKYNEEQRRPGRIIIFAVSNDKIDNIAYNAGAGGAPSSPLKISEFIYKIINSNDITLDKINTNQARIVDVDLFLDKDISVYTIDDGMKNIYESQIRDLLS